MRTRWTVSILAIAFLSAAPGFSEMKQPWIGEAAPAFSLSTLDGNKLSLADLKGKLVVLHFGAGW